MGDREERKELHCVTKKDEKVELLQRLLGSEYAVRKHPWEIPYSYNYHPEQVALHKVRSARRQAPHAFVAWQQAVEFDAWPGLLYKLDFLDYEGVEAILHKVSGRERGCSVREYVAYGDGEAERVFSQDYRGAIAASPRGENGDAFMRLYVPGSLPHTAAELPTDFYKLYWEVLRGVESPAHQLKRFLRGRDSGAEE